MIVLKENTSGTGLLVESVDFALTKPEIIVEASGLKEYYINGIFAQTEVVNKNGRSYKKMIMEREVGRYVTEKVKTNRAVGELDHPDTIKLNPQLVSHRMTELFFDNNDVRGKALVLDTPCGLILKRFTDGGVAYGVSTRGTGTVKNAVVQEDFYLATIDAVLDPSAPKAMVDITLESEQWIDENDLLSEENFDRYKKMLSKLPKKDVDVYLVNVMRKFISEISVKKS